MKISAQQTIKASLVAVVFGLLAGLMFLASPGAWAGPAQQGGHRVVIYLFWGDGCPHCAAEKPFLEDLANRNPNVEVRQYEVWYNADNRDLLLQMAAAYGFEPTAVPTTFIGDRYWVGYADSIGQEMEAVVSGCATSGCPDAGQGIVPGSVAEDPTQDPPVAAAVAAATADVLTIPLIGPVNLAAQSLVVSTSIVAFVDGFNPCSLWVLSILLALSLHSGSRKKVFLVGLVFITVTAAVYALFIAGLFTMFTVVSFLGWIQGVVALVALFFALVNIKDYFWYQEGISFTIGEEKKPGIYRGMRRVMDAGNSPTGLIGATVVLAAGVSLVEFSCTAGFPVLWTNLLIAQGATALTFGLLLLLYMLIYQIDELGIFLVAVVTLKANKLEERHGRILKLAGGMLMLALAAVMLIDPALMSRLSTSLWVFVAAFIAAGLVLLVHRTLLPRLGIYIGTEMRPRGTRRRLRRQRA